MASGTQSSIYFHREIMNNLKPKYLEVKKPLRRVTHVLNYMVQDDVEIYRKIFARKENIYL